MAPPLEVVEFTDPACPWAWGSEPVFRRLRLLLAGQANWRFVDKGQTVSIHVGGPVRVNSPLSARPV